jgi:hypothetical protein
MGTMPTQKGSQGNAKETISTQEEANINSKEAVPTKAEFLFCTLLLQFFV